MARCTDCQRESNCADPKCRGYHARSGCICSRCANAFIAGEPKRLTLIEMFEKEKSWAAFATPAAKIYRD